MPQNSDSKIKEVNFRKGTTRYIQRELLRSVRDTLELEPNPVGFALVVWDSTGAPTVSTNTISGPIGSQLVGPYCESAIRNVVVERNVLNELGGPRLPTDKI